YRNTSYLKIDIEGAEYPILERMARISVPQISIEFHHHCSTEYALPQTIALIQKIVDMGYDAIDYGAFHGAERKLPEFVSRWSDLNCELLFIRK
ncbi:MAG: Methyltransferase domain, partial [Myxococcales bacterium]|nr:Methyltransferase domain [Myxococcales bacterium]